jgi:hypothetical protein
MLSAPGNKLASVKLLAALSAGQMAVGGLLLILIGNAFSLELVNVSIDSVLSNLGALLVVVGLLQWHFDNNLRFALFEQIRTEALASNRVIDSGICDYYEHSKDVDLKEFFVSSSDLIIGVNYSARLIDNSINLLDERVKSGKKTTVICILEGSTSATFLGKSYGIENIDGDIGKLKRKCKEIDPSGKMIEVIQIDSVLRYSFILFDSRAWIVFGSNASGRKSVPGFFVRRSGSWYTYFSKDVEQLVSQARALASREKPLQDAS